MKQQRIMKQQRRMNGRYRQALAVMVAVTCLMIIGFTQPVQPLDQADLNRRALQQVAMETQVPLAQLVLDGSETLDFPLLQVQVHAYKIRNNRTHEMYSVILNEWGQITDIQALSITENRLYFERFGRMDKALAEHLESRPASAEEEVIIWVKEPYYEPLPSPTLDEIRTLDDLHRYQARVYEHRSNFVRGVTAEAMWKFQNIGYLVDINESEPVIYARLPVGLIKELSRDTFNWPEVDRLYKPVEMQSLMDVSRRTVMADVAHYQSPVIEGFGVRVGMAEARNSPAGAQSGRVAAGFTGAAAVNNNPYLHDSNTTVNTTNLGAGSGAHATEVAGVIRMLDIGDEVFRGIAPWVNLWAGGGTSYAHLETAINNAIGGGGGQGNSSVVNMSYGGVETQGTPGAHSRFCDSIVFNNSRTLVVAAGNSGADAVAANRRVNTPGDAYNVITAGNLDDNGTVRWNDDSIRASSSFGLATARMKPELVAPGTNIQTTGTTAPWNNDTVTGTSFSAPHVTGNVALMIEAKPYVAAWPELIKAILMCNALHNVTNAPGTRAATGCIITNQSVEHAKNPNANMGWATGNVGADCNAPPGGDWVFNLNAGQRIRFVMCWRQNPNWGPADANGYAARPSADYDLQLIRVVNAQEQIVSSSNSSRNNFEIIDYTIPVNQGGQYKVRLLTFRCGDAAIANNAATRSPGRRAIAYRIDPKNFAYVDATISNRNVYKLGQATLTATLRNIQNDNPLNNKQIRFRLRNYSPGGTSVDIAIGIANTNAQGVATLNWNIPANATLGRYRMVAEFLGDNNFEYTSGATKAFVYPARTKINAQNQAGNPGQVVQLRGTLICTENNTRLPGKEITFGIEGVTVGTAVTNVNGVATLNFAIPANWPAGGRRLDMFFNGDDVYDGGYGRATLAVGRALVQGQIQLDSNSGPLDTLTARIVVKQGGNTETIDTALDSSGNYAAVTSLSGANATVSAKINGGSWLRERTSVANLTGLVTVDFTLLNGDANRDNRIDDADLLAVLFDFGRAGSNLNSDLNRDGRVDDADLLIVLFNFGATGGPQ
jgi:hypothetical protein